MDQRTIFSPTNDTLFGTIEHFVFQSDESGFVVFTLQTKQLGKITVTGTLPALVVGQDIELIGAWKLHKKFGKQFEATRCTTNLPSTPTGLKRYLGSGLIKGIGKVYAEKLVDRFGSDILTIIDQNPERLAEVPGIGTKRIEQIAAAWQDQKGIASIMVFLQDKGISAAYATKIYKHYKERAIAIIEENPYRLADDIWGIGFKTADAIAQKIGIARYAPQRIQAGMLFTLSQATKLGHLYLEKTVAREQAQLLLELDDEHQQAIDDAITALNNQEKIVMVSDQEKLFLAPTSHYYCETGCAQRLAQLLESPSPLAFKPAVLADILEHPQHASIVLNQDQKRGIITALTNKVTIVTGGPGTGKTTLIRELLSVLDHHSISYKLAAPTGRAAKRIAEGTGRHATTIHRLLEFDMTNMGFKHHDRNPLVTQVLIIDEASMIDIFLAHALLKAIPPTAHLLLLGDVDQLPSVGAGNVLNDCIASGVIPTVRLTEIFRQARNSLIIVNAHRINQGEFPYSPSQESQDRAPHDFLFVKEQESEQFHERLKNVLATELPKRGIAPEAAAILCPMNRGNTGTQALNAMLQELFNRDATSHLVYAGTTFKVNDKVMQIRNNYDKMVFNGDTGILAEINHEDQLFTVQFEERSVSYDFDEINEIILAYAMTIHKSQGSEYAAVIIPLFTQHFTLLQRNLIYTAVTRAKKLCIIIGQVKALAIALKNNKAITRNTFLRKLLQERTLNCIQK